MPPIFRRFFKSNIYDFAAKFSSKTDQNRNKYLIFTISGVYTVIELVKLSYCGRIIHLK